jgi:hypothetical protein
MNDTSDSDNKGYPSWFEPLFTGRTPTAEDLRERIGSHRPSVIRREQADIAHAKMLLQGTEWYP